jgi:hypothetical protein
VEQLTFTDNIIENCGAGFVLKAPLLASGFISKQIVISRNRFRNVGGPNLQVYGGDNDGNVSTVNGVEITHNDLRDFAQTGPAGPIPIEPTCVTNLLIANNVIDGTATRGISMGNNVNATVTGNTVRNQSTYAFELNGGRQISIVGNTAENCGTLAVESGGSGVAAPNPVRLSDLVIANNVYIGSSQAPPAGLDVIQLASARRVRISGNTFNNWRSRTAVRVGSTASLSTEDVVVESNTFIISDPTTPLLTVNIVAGVRTNIVRNTIRVTRDLAATDDYVAAISAAMQPASSDTVIDSNHILFTGNLTASPNCWGGIGNNFVTPAACPKLTIRGNHVIGAPRGINLRTTSTDLTVYGNDTATCVAGNVIPVGALGMPSIELGSASDTTLTRLSAGKLGVENAEVSLTGHKHVAGDVTGALAWTTTVPTTPAAAGTRGQVTADASFMYVHTGAGWKRLAFDIWV